MSSNSVSKLSVIYRFILGLGLFFAMHTAVSAKQILTSDELIEKSGLASQFGSLHDAFGDTFKELVAGGEKPDAKFNSAWQDAVDANFDPKNMVARLSKLLDDKFTSDQLVQLKSFYDSKFGKRVTAMEVKAQSTENEMKLMMKLPKLMEESKNNPKRMEILNGIIEDMRVRESAATMLDNIGMGMQLGMAASGKVPATTFEEMKKKSAAQGAMLKSMTLKILPPIMLDTYSSLSDEELTTYRKFLTSPAGMKFYEVVTDAQHKIVSDGVARFAKQLMTNLGLDPI